MSPDVTVRACGRHLDAHVFSLAALVCALLALAIPVAPARADHPGGELGVPGMSEAELRSFERSVLGPAHAAEHARTRAAKRAGRLSPAAPASASAVRAAAALAGPPEQVGRWGNAFPIPVIGIHAALLPTGKVMWFSYPENPNPTYGNPNAPNTAQAWLWDPATGLTNRVDPPVLANGQPANIWCAGQTFTADGRLVVFGGNLAYAEPSWKGLNKVYTFNPWNETWAEQEDMDHGRWYPTGVRLSDGRIAIISGLDESGGDFATSRNPDVELFTPSADLNGRGTVDKIGTIPETGAVRVGGLYPHMFAMPSGRTLVAGPFVEDTWFLNSPGSSNLFTDYQNMAADRVWGAAVLVPGGTGGSTRVMQLGGSTSTSTTSVPTAETFDEANPGAGWQTADQMRIGRGHHNTVLLPDGSMVTVGGGLGTGQPGGLWAATADQRQVELWDPVSGDWRLGAAQAEARAYHSTALLLPDGRVISAGDDVNGGINQDTAEIYEPPYLFKGPRPVISSSPPTERVGDSFDVYTPDTNVTRAALVAPGATTHANDMNQRYIPLTVTQRPGGVILTAPANADIATPGQYMLFLINDQGVPSVAKFMRLGQAWEPQPPPTPLPPSSPSSPSAGPADRTGPKLRFNARSGFNRKRWTLAGSASDPSGVRRVEFALALKQGRRCRFWSPRRRALGRLRSCSRRVFVRASLSSSGSPRRWKAKLRGPLPPGLYRLTLKGTDRMGNTSRRTGIRLRVTQRRG